MAIDPKQMQAVFFEVLVAQPAERASILDRACAGNAELRQRIEQLLRAHEDSEELPAAHAAATEDTTGFDATQSYTSSEPTPGMVIASRYTLEQKLGEGGMGEVWVAKQSEPVKRKVALKLIKAGMDTKSVVQRFEQERQALAMMDHPNIAKVLDGGITADRRPFFVMELVNGLPLTKFCDETKLGISERLELFVPICQAVQHAHQKGIVHRDLKPGNILVTMIDGKPVPKVIDFGVAKATSGRLTEESLSTQFGAVVGTLEYMSPEQAGFSGDDVDTRADIYSLGVILYELLTGLRPFDSKRMKKAALDEMIRIIREEEPSKPSTRLSTDESLPSLAAVRHIEPGKLTALLRGELDWVVMKCLEKQRERRYESANGLARDIQRYLADEMVEARPPSTGYLLRKFIRRNQGTVIAASLVVFALLAGMAGTTWGMLRAESAHAAETTERQRATEAEKLALSERDSAKAVNAFLLEDLLQQASAEGQTEPGRYANPDIKLLTVLDRASKRVEGRFAMRPREEAAIRFTLGNTYRALGKYALAEMHLQRALELCRRELGEENLLTLTALNDLATQYLYQAKYVQAEALFLKVREIGRRVLGLDHHLPIIAANNLGNLYGQLDRNADAVTILTQALGEARQHLGAGNVHTLAVTCNLALAEMRLGRLEQAESRFQEGIDAGRSTLGLDHPTMLGLRLNLAGVYCSQKRLDKAEEAYSRALDDVRHGYGDEHPDVVSAMHGLTTVYLAQRKFAQAEQWARKCIEASLRVHAADHPQVLAAKNSLAVAYYWQDKIVQARPLFEDILEVHRRRGGDEHSDTLTMAHNLAVIYRRLALHTELEALLKWQLASARRMKGPVDVAEILDEAGTNFINLRKLPEAVTSLAEALALREKHAPNSWETFNTKSLLGTAFFEQKQLSEAEPHMLAGYLGMKKRQDMIPPHNKTVVTQSEERLIQLYIAVGKKTEAVELLQEQLADSRKTLPKESSQLAGRIAPLGLALLELKEYVKAEALLRECLAIREKKEPNDWRTFNTQSLLGGALLGRKKYAEAEPLLLKGYEGMKVREKTIPPQGNLRLPEALDRLIQFYTETNKPDEVKKWQAEKDKLPKPEPVKK